MSRVIPEPIPIVLPSNWENKQLKDEIKQLKDEILDLEYENRQLSFLVKRFYPNIELAIKNIKENSQNE